ncbi:MAG: LysM peptidoglycan-binding domain-containing protein [Proteobacteria bacterium]|nr:LysM peptidoglycan-binding domain-containing protein [Pseudomonadota bacterium]
MTPAVAPHSHDELEHFVCVDGLRLDVGYSPDRQTARISAGRASLISLRRVPQEGYLAYESGAVQFLREGPRAVFINQPTSIEVKSGDTLGAIARRLYGESSRVRDIMNANPEALADPNLIYVGQVLQLPHGRHLCRRTLT